MPSPDEFGTGRFTVRREEIYPMNGIRYALRHDAPFAAAPVRGRSVVRDDGPMAHFSFRQSGEHAIDLVHAVSH